MATRKKAAKKAAKKTTRKAAPRKAAAGTTEARAPRKTATKPAKPEKGYTYQAHATKDGSVVSSALQGPFANVNDALEDAGIQADEGAEVVLYREVKRGRIQKSSKFVASR